MDISFLKLPSHIYFLHIYKNSGEYIMKLPTVATIQASTSHVYFSRQICFVAHSHFSMVKIGEPYQEQDPLGDQQQRGQLEAAGRLPQGVTGEGPVPHPVRGHPPNTPRMVQRRWGSQCVCGSVQAGCMHNTQPYLFQNSEPTNMTHNNGQL